jgi:hypothetical protein
MTGPTSLEHSTVTTTCPRGILSIRVSGIITVSSANRFRYQYLTMAVAVDIGVRVQDHASLLSVESRRLSQLD